jgi:hypothetical protein
MHKVARKVQRRTGWTDGSAQSLGAYKDQDETNQATARTEAINFKDIEVPAELPNGQRRCDEGDESSPHPQTHGHKPARIRVQEHPRSTKLRPSTTTTPFYQLVRQVCRTASILRPHHDLAEAKYTAYHKVRRPRRSRGCCAQLKQFPESGRRSAEKNVANKSFNGLSFPLCRSGSSCTGNNSVNDDDLKDDNLRETGPVIPSWTSEPVLRGSLACWNRPRLTQSN